MYGPCLFCHVNISIQNIEFCMYFISVELLAIYDWITIMRYKECKLSTINMFSSLNKLSYYPSLAPHKGHLSTLATFVCPQGGSCVERFDCNQFHWNNFF